MISIFREYGFTREGLLATLGFMLALYFAIVLHEIAHGYVALRCGDPTAKVNGRLTMNPSKHFNLFGFLMLLFVGFGFANPVPINPYNFKNKRRGEIWVSLAGILTNLGLAFIFVAFYMILSVYISNHTILVGTFAYYLVWFLQFFLLYFVLININLALFNVLPLYPLDGARFVEATFGESNFTLFLRRYSFPILMILFFLEVLPILGAYSPLSLYILNVRAMIVDLFMSFWGLLI